MSGFQNSLYPIIVVAADRNFLYLCAQIWRTLPCKPEGLQMKYFVLLIVLTTLSGCGAGKAAMDAGKGFDRFACMSRNIKGETPCPQPDNQSQTP